MFNNLMTSVKGATAKVIFGAKKHSPEILVVSGIVGTIAATVMACKATTKIEDILDEHKKLMDAAKKAASDEEETEYTEDDLKKDTVIVYTKTAVKLAKLYAPSVALGILSISAILGGHHILRKRNAALAAAYAAADTAFKEYRKRVVDRFGEEVDFELKNGVKKEKIEKVVTDEDGKEKKVKEEIAVTDNLDGSPYAKFFTKANPNWENDKDYVEMFLRAQESYANDKLRINKHLTLNEVYRDLGLKETKAGMVVGWIFDEACPNGDNYIHFDVREVYIPSEDGSNYERAYSIDFNVDGSIYDKIV